MNFKAVSESMSIDGRRVAFVGKLGSMNRRDARDLVKKHGGIPLDRVNSDVDLIVIGADELPIGENDDLLADWVIESSASGQLEIISETQLWQDLGLVDPDLDVGRLYTPAMLAKLLDLPVSTIRRWHRRGLITPARQVNKLAYFDFQEVASARRIARFIAEGASPKAVETKLSRLAELYPELQRPLSQLSVIVEGKHVLLSQGEGLIEPGGQMRIDFDGVDLPAIQEETAVISLEQAIAEKSIDQLQTPEEFIDLAVDFEDAGEFASAIEVYRALSLAFGPNADICFRIAELLYQQMDLGGARERYYMAIEMDETFVEARGNLGCVLVEQGEIELAYSAFVGALEHHADYPDVHFHLARLLDDTDREDDATVHWERFLELAPRSPWAEEARERLGVQV